MSSIPFYLVTGFLGSGKTTLLKKILSCHSSSRRIAIIQNEFAPASVDGVELRRTGLEFELMEINRGSVFCVCLLSDFISSLKNFLQKVTPDAVVLEATGLADPIALAEFLGAPELRDRIHLAHTWCILDATSFLKMDKTLRRLSHQVRIADTVVVNKIDRGAGNLEAISLRIKELNPFADIVATTYCRAAVDGIFSAKARRPVALKRQHQGIDPGDRPDMDSAVIRTTKKISFEALQRFLADQSGKIYRLKGFVLLEDGRTAAVQSSFDELKIEFISGYSGASEIVAMGPGVTAAELSRYFRKQP